MKVLVNGKLAAEVFGWKWLGVTAIQEAEWFREAYAKLQNEGAIEQGEITIE